MIIRTFSSVHMHITNGLHHQVILNIETWYFNKLMHLGSL